MKLVIDISEDDYEIIKYCGCLPEPFEIFRVAIQNGTPLEEELEKIKERIAQIDKIFYPDLNFNNIGDCYVDRKLVAEAINKRIAELKGENK